MIVDIFFRFLNFGLLIGLGAYVFYKKLLPMLLVAMRKKLFEKEAILDEIEHLTNLQKEALRHRERQEKHLQEMAQKIDTWRNVWQERNQNIKDEYERQKELIVQKRASQEENYQVVKVYQEAAPKIVAKVSGQLETLFSDANEQKVYNEKIVSFLKEQL